MTARAWRVALALVLATGCAAAAEQAPPAAEPAWTTLQSAHLTVLTDAEPARVSALTVGLESVRAAMREVLEGRATESPVPVYGVFFRDAAGLAPYAWRSTTGDMRQTGFFAAGEGLAFLAATADEDGGEARRTALHEYAHHVVHLDWSRIPLWLNEGLAEYFSTCELRDGEAVLGAPPPAHPRWIAAHGLLPLRAIAATTVDETKTGEAARVGAVYAESWAFVHFLMHDAEVDRRAQLRRVLALCAAGRPFDEAFVAAFGASYEDLDAPFAAYVGRAAWTRRSVALGERASTGTGRAAAADPAWRDALLGWLLLTARADQAATAAARFDAALTRNPAQPLALAGKGRLAAAAGRLAEAKALLERAVTGDPSDHLAPYLLATTLLDELAARPPAARDAATTTPVVLRARELLERALARRPDFAEALARLGVAYGQEPVDTARAAAALERARTLLPSDSEILGNLVLVYRRAGRTADADAAFRALCAVDPAGCANQRAAGALEARLGEVRRLFDEKRYAEGCAALEAVLPDVTDPAAKADISTQVAQCRADLQRKACVGDYNRAVELANARATRKALEALNGAVPKCRGTGDVQKEMVRLQDVLSRRLKAGG